MIIRTREPIDPSAMGHLQDAFDRAWQDFPKEVLKSVQTETVRDLLARAVVAASADGITDVDHLAHAALRGVLGDSLDASAREPIRRP